MNEYFTLKQIDEIADAIRARSDTQPHVGMILGSGLGAVAEYVGEETVIPYDELPSWPVSTVVGHKGRLVGTAGDRVNFE